MWATVAPMAERPKVDVDVLEEEAKQLLVEMDARRSELTELAAKRRVVVQQMVDAVGMPETAQRLGVSRQAVWNTLNPKT